MITTKHLLKTIRLNPWLTATGYSKLLKFRKSDGLSGRMTKLINKNKLVRVEGIPMSGSKLFKAYRYNVRKSQEEPSE